MKSFFPKAILVISLIIGFAATDILAKKVSTGLSEKTELQLIHSSQHNLMIRNTVSQFHLDVIGMPEGDYCRISIPAFSRSSELGHPELPVRRQLIEIPYGATPEVRIISFSEKEYSLADYGIEIPLIPLQPPQPKCGNDPAFVCNLDQYKVDQYTTTDLVSVDVLGFLRGVRIARVNINPVSYNPVQNTIRVYKDIEFEIIFKDADLGQTEYMKKRYGSPYFTSLYRSLPNFVKPATRENLTKYPVKYLIISDRMFEDQLQPFIEWKQQKGFQVIEAYTDEIGSSKSEIKDYIKNLYDEGTESDPAPSFVLFVGDIAQIPAWDNGNGVTDRNYVEYTNDLFPEIFYGRFSAENTTHLQPFIDKTLQYEQFTMPDPAYLEEVVLVAGMDSGHGHDWGNGQINYATINYFNEEHDIYSQTYLYPESGNHSADIRQDISDGVTFANYTAHCGPDGWSDPTFSISHIAALDNQDKYGLLIGNCCSSSEYQTTCFGEEIVRAENKGAVGYIGASNSSYWDEDYYFGVGVGEINENPPDYEETTLGNYDRSFHDHGEVFGDWFATQDQHVFAGNLAVSESGSSAEEYYWDIYNLMGDPSLMVYYGYPDEMDVDHDPFIMIGTGTFTVTTVPYAYVSLNWDGENKGVILADENGLAELQFNPISSPGNAELVITAQNRQPWIEDVLVIAPEGPFCIYKEHSLNDDSLGNGNQHAEFDEASFLNITLENYGNDDANDVLVSLTSSNPYVSIIDGEEVYDTIKSGQTVSKEDGFLFELADNVPDQMIVKFELLATDTQDSSWTSEFSISAFAPVLAPLDLIVEDQDGNGRLDPGDTAVIKVRTANSGHCPIENVSASLVAYNPFVTVLSGDTTLPYLGLLGSSSPEFEVVVAADAPEGFLAEMHYTLAAAGYEVMKVYKPKIGQVLEDWETGNFSKYDWEIDGDEGWTINNLYPYEGLFDAKSGQISHGQDSEFSIRYEVMSFDSISFFKKVSSEDGYDKLTFHIDGAMKGQWSGTTQGWTKETFPVSPGIHTFKWIYAKDYYTSTGADCAWVDNIQLPTMMATSVFAGPDEESCTNNEYFQCYGAATNYDSIYWSTSGSGTFNAEYIMMPQYTPSEQDIIDGELMLSLSLIDVDGEFASDTMQLTFKLAPEAPSLPEGPDKVELDLTTETEYTTELVEGASGYLWSIHPDTAGTISGGGTTALVSWNLQFEGFAWVKVAAINDCGPGDFSDSLWISVSDPVGMQEIKHELIVQVMPNPSNGKFSLSFTATEPQEVHVGLINYLGQYIADEKVFIVNGKYEITFDLRKFDQGVYFAVIQTNTSRKVVKLLINN